MADLERKELARAAGDGDLDAAKTLVTVIEREGADPLATRVMGRIEAGKSWREALLIARANATGRLWLVGGKVYRTLAEVLEPARRSGAASCDYDFIAVGKTPIHMIPQGGSWHASDRPKSETDLGTRKFHRNGRSVVDLLTMELPSRRGFSPDIEGYFKTVPFDVQAIAIDIDAWKLVGPGIQAVRSGRLEVNNAMEAEACAAKAGVTLDELLNQRSWSLGFTSRPKPKPRPRARVAPVRHDSYHDYGS